MSEIHGAVGSYVVNALDPDELHEFEAHLAVCPTCSREIQEFGETAAELSLLASVRSLIRLLRFRSVRSTSWRYIDSGGVPASSACWLPQSWRLRWRWVAFSTGLSSRDKRK